MENKSYQLRYLPLFEQDLIIKIFRQKNRRLPVFLIE